MDAQQVFFKLLFNPKQDGRVFLFFRRFTVSKGQFKGKQFDSGFFDILREAITGTVFIDADFRSQIAFG